MRKWIAGLFFVLAASAVANAKPALPPARDPVLGAWSFQTGVFGQCRIHGDMVIEPTTTPNVYRCRFTSFETCPDLKIRAVQTCTAAKSGDRLEIKATLVEVAPQLGYAPDNWSLKVLGPARMQGELRSADTAPAEFFRAQGAIS